MRSLARMGCALAALAMAAPTLAQAGMPIAAPGPYNAGKSAFKKKKVERLCAECLRAKVKKEQGIIMPPSGPLPAGVPVKGTECTKCGRVTMVDTGPKTPSNALPGMAATGMVGGAMVYEAPGHAVVGDAPMFAGNGVDPAPIGMVGPRVAGMMPNPSSRPGLRDSAVMPTAMEASEPVGMPDFKRPHIVTHLLDIDLLGRRHRFEREERKRETHAKISYDQSVHMVNDLPLSSVYGWRAPK
jgi:hypothetical protein